MSLTGVALTLAGFQTAMILRNISLYETPRTLLENQHYAAGMSVLIPARNEEDNLPSVLESLVGQQSCRFEVIVLDDHSTDRTFQVAQEYALRDPRFQVVRSRTLPPGWAGKQFACHQLSEQARYDQWLFLDADVVLTHPEALARMGLYLERSPAAMVSSIPRQLTGTWAERLIIPLIHLVLLGFLPIWEMRRNRLPALGAACGQLVAVKRKPYRETGGHSSVKHRLHDATALAAHMRSEGHLTDLFDSTSLATCRMYSKALDVFSGFAKNATEGMARPAALWLWTVLLLGANVLPWGLGATGHLNWQVVAAQILNIVAYVVLMWKFRQSVWGALTRPAGVLVFVAIQWVALIGKWMGWKASWKGRLYDRIYE